MSTSHRPDADASPLRRVLWFTACGLGGLTALLGIVVIFGWYTDNDDLIRWLTAMNASPKRVFLTHGEEDSALALKSSIQDQLGLEVEIPNYKSSFDLE